MNGIQHHFFGAFLGIWAGYVLHIDQLTKETYANFNILTLFGYTFYAIILIGCATGLVYIHYLASKLRNNNASRFRIYGTIVLGSFLAFTTIYTLQGIFLPNEFHTSYLQLALIMPINIFWSICEEM